MADDSGSSNKIANFATIVSTLLAVGAFVQSLWVHQEGASTQTASRNSYGVVGGRIKELSQTSEQQSAAIEKLWEAMAALQARQPAATTLPPTTNPAPVAAASPHKHAHGGPAGAGTTSEPTTTAPTATATPPAPSTPTAPAAGTASPAAAGPAVSGGPLLGALKLQHVTDQKLPSYDDLSK